MRRIIGFTLFLFVAVVAMGAVYSVTRSHYVTQLVRERLIPLVEDRTGLAMTVDRVLLSPFPLYVEARGVEFRLNEDQGHATRVEKVRAYISLNGIFSRVVTVRYLWAEGVMLSARGFPWSLESAGTAGEQPTAAVPEGGEDSEGNGTRIPLPGGFSLEIARALVDRLAFDVELPEREAKISGEGSRIALRPGRIPRVSVTIPDMSLGIRGRDVFEGSFRGRFFWSGHSLQVAGARLESSAADWIELAGGLSEEAGAFELNARVSLASLEGLLGRQGAASPGFLAVKGRVEGAAGVLVRDPVVDLAVEAEARVEDVLGLLGLDPYVSGDAMIRGKYHGRLRDGILEGDGKLEDGTIVGLSGAGLATRFRWQGDLLTFENVDGNLLGGRVTEGTVSLNFEDEIVYQVVVDVTEVSSHRLFEYIGWIPPHREGRLNGRLDLQGEGNDWKKMLLSGNFTYESDGAGSELVERIQSAFGRMELSEGRLSLENVSFYGDVYGGWGEATIDLDTTWMNVEVGIVAKDIGALMPAGDLEAAGSLMFSGNLAGLADSPVLRGEVRLSEATLGDLAFEQAQGSLGWSYGILKLDDFTVRAKDFSLRLEGEVDLPIGEGHVSTDTPAMRLRVSSKGLEVAQALTWFHVTAPVSGTAAGDVYFVGNADGRQFGIQAVLTDGVAYGQRYDRAIVKARYDGSTVEIDHLMISSGEASLGVSGRVDPSWKPCLNLRGSGISMGTITIVPESLDGEMDVDMTCSREGGMAGTATFRGLKFGEVPLGDVSLAVREEEHDWTFGGELFGGRVPLSGRVSPTPVLSWSVDANVREDEYADVLRGFLPSLGDDVSVAGRGRLALTGKQKEVHGTFSLDTLQLAAMGKVFSLSRPVVIAIDDSRLDWNTVTLKDEATVVTISGDIDFGNKLSLDVAGELDLGWLGRMFPAIDASSGVGEISLSSRSAWEKPVWTGTLAVRNGELLFRDMPFRITKISGDVVIQEQVLRLPRMEAEIGGGRLSATGIVRTKGISLDQFHIDLSARDVRLRVSPDMFVAFDGNLIYDGTADRQGLSGDIQVKRARYTGRVDWRDWILKAKRQDRLLLKGGRWKTTELNIHVSGRDDIEVRNNIARTRLMLDLYLKGQAGAPRLLGRLESAGGLVFFREREFEILSGNAEFMDPTGINPVLSISARTEVQNYTIRLGLDGPIDRLTLSLYSDPPLSDVDILSLLTVGKRREDLANIEGAVGASEAASFLTGSLQDAIESNVKDVTGFDRFQVDPYVNSGTGEVGPRLTVGKRFISDKFNVSYSVNVGTTDEQTLRVEYLMNRNVSIIGVRGEQGDLGADIKLKYQFE